RGVPTCRSRSPVLPSIDRLKLRARRGGAVEAEDLLDERADGGHLVVGGSAGRLAAAVGLLPLLPGPEAKLIELLAELRHPEDVRAPELVGRRPVDESDGEAERVRLALKILVQEEARRVVPPLRDGWAAAGVLGDFVRQVVAEAVDVFPRRLRRRRERRSLSLT